MNIERQLLTASGEPGEALDPETLSVRTAYQSLKDSQRTIGLHRIKMGALLCLLKKSEAWRGRTDGQSFRKFLVEEGVEPRAAHQYMKVAEVFVLNLRIPKRELWKIAHASMRVLTAAASVVNDRNVLEVIDIVATQPRPEALDLLRALSAPVDVNQPPSRADRSVSAIIDKVGDLTFVQKAELFNVLGMQRNARA